MGGLYLLPVTFKTCFRTLYLGRSDACPLYVPTGRAVCLVPHAEPRTLYLVPLYLIPDASCLVPCVPCGLLCGVQVMYAQLGARSGLVRACHDLPARLELRCDGRLVELPGETTRGVPPLAIRSLPLASCLLNALRFYSPLPLRLIFSESLPIVEHETPVLYLEFYGVLLCHSCASEHLSESEKNK